MSADVTVAIVSDGAVRAYHRNGGALAQVAQLAVAADVDPAAMAAAMADLGDMLGWHGAGGIGQPAGAAGRAAGALPAAPPAELPVAHPVAAQPPRRKPKARKRLTPVQVQTIRDEVLAVVRGKPGILRSEVARIVDADPAVVKRCTDWLLAHDVIDAAVVPGVRARGPGGGHGLFARMVQPDAQVS
jgi:hypothetical protein